MTEQSKVISVTDGPGARVMVSPEHRGGLGFTARLAIELPEDNYYRAVYLSTQDVERIIQALAATLASARKGKP